MKFQELEINGVFLIEIVPIEDERGFFSRAWCKKEYEAHGLNTGLVQQNIGYSKYKGTVRGMHYQAAPYSEVKVVRCSRGAIYDVVVDLRKDSPTFMKWCGVELTQDNHKTLYVPEGIAHGYQTLTDNAEMFYYTTQFYAPEHATGVRYNDPAFAIQWPLSITEMSENDKSWDDFSIPE